MAPGLIIEGVKRSNIGEIGVTTVEVPDESFIQRELAGSRKSRLQVTGERDGAGIIIDNIIGEPVKAGNFPQLFQVKPKDGQEEKRLVVVVGFRQEKPIPALKVEEMKQTVEKGMNNRLCLGAIVGTIRDIANRRE